MAASPRLEASYRKVCSQVEQIAGLAADHELHALAAPKVSAWSVGRQLEHLLLSDQTILDRFDRLIDGREGPAPGGPTATARLLLWLGYIPRGVGKAPQMVVPAGRDPADIEASLGRLRERLGEFAGELPLLEEAGWRCRHPVFGALDIGEWLRFMDTHHRHHLRIVRDIRRAAA